MMIELQHLLRFSLPQLHSKIKERNHRVAKNKKEEPQHHGSDYLYATCYYILYPQNYRALVAKTVNSKRKSVPHFVYRVQRNTTNYIRSS